MQFAASTSMKAVALAAGSVELKWGVVLCGFALLVLLYVSTAVFTKYWNPMKLVEGADGRASTFKFQWFLWLIVTLFAYTALWVLRAVKGNFSALSGIPVSFLVALGLSTGTMAVAKGITTTYVQIGRVTKPTLAAGSAKSGILRDDNGVLELAKIQLVGFTVILIGIFLTAVVRQILSNEVTAGLPNIDASLTVLLAISQGAYLGKKLVAFSPQNWLGLPSRSIVGRILSRRK